MTAALQTRLARTLTGITLGVVLVTVALAPLFHAAARIMA
jgi:hypothetical protein